MITGSDMCIANNVDRSWSLYFSDYCL